MSIPKLVGGIGEINFGKQFRQGNRVYDSEEVAMCLMAQPVGNAGGYSYLYLLKNKERGIKRMWKNELKKYEFNMDEVRVFDVFAGIGSLHQSLKDLGVPVRITNLSEIDIDATISYAAGHIENFKDLEFEYPSDTEMKEWLMARNIGYSYEKNKSSVPRMKKEKLKLAYKASVLLNNLGDIAKIDYDKIEDFDLMNFSFSCTDISNAGKQKGMKNEDGTPTRSGLYIYGIKAIRVKRPKYIMIENVKGLIQKKFIDDFYSIVEELNEVGYNCYYPTKTDKKQNEVPICLNAKDFGIPQNRERIFVICIRKDIDDGTFEFPVGRDQGIRLKDVLEDEVDKKYYLSEEIQNRFKLNGSNDENHNELNVVGTSAPDFRTIGQRDLTYGINGIMSTLTATDYKQPKQILENELNCVGMLDIKGNEQIRRVYDSQNLSPTLSTMQGGNRQPKIIDINKLSEDGKTVCEFRCDEGIRYFKDNVCGTIKTIDAGGDKRVIENIKIQDNNRLIKLQDGSQSNRVYDTKGLSPTIAAGENGGGKRPGGLFYNDYKIRKLTPLECWRLMGFSDENFYKAKELGISDSQLYKQAGNSIVTNCLYYIFKNVFSKYIVREF